MIKNRRELEAVAAQWVTRAKQDLRNQMIAFIEANGTNEAELADALAISLDEIDQILNGNGEISLSTFAKLLIATDNVIEIKPAHIMRQQFGGRMPRQQMPMQERRPMGQMPRGRMPFPPMGGMPMPPMGEGMEGYPMPPMDGMPFPPMGEEMPQPQRFGGMPGMSQRIKKNQPNRLPNGRFAPKNHPQGQMQRVRLDEIELDELGKAELSEIIRQNHWDSEIDLNSRRGELIEFLNYKINSQPPMVEEPREETENEKIARMLAEEVARNPHLKDIVKKYL